MPFKVSLEVALPPYSLRSNPKKLQLVDLQSGPYTRPYTPLKKYLIPSNTRIWLNIQKEGEDTTDLSGHIFVTRDNHLESCCQSTAVDTGRANHDETYIHVGPPIFKAFMVFYHKGIKLKGRKLNRVQLSFEAPCILTSYCTCLMTIHICGVLNGQEIDATILANLIGGQSRSVNRGINYNSFHVESGYTIRGICFCEHCLSYRENEDIRKNKVLIDRVQFLTKDYTAEEKKEATT